MTLYGAAASSVVWWVVWPAATQLVVWLVVSAAFGSVVVRQLHLIGRSGGTPRRTFDRVLARNIGVVIVAYAIAEAASAVLLHLLQHDALIFPIAVGIAGIHFFVFARVLDTWQYYVTGAMDCLAALGSVLLVGPGSRIGAIPSLVFYPLLGGGIALFVTAGLMLYESQTVLSALPRASH